jgi:hypothetical protein
MSHLQFFIKRLDLCARRPEKPPTAGCPLIPSAVFPFRMATRMITKGGGQFGTSMNLGGAPPMGSLWEVGHCYLSEVGGVIQERSG